MIFRILFSIVTWVLFYIMLAVLILLGWILIPIATFCKAYEKRQSLYHEDAFMFKKSIMAWTWPFMWLWGNEEDGINAGKGYLDLKYDWAQTIYWSAFRNPVNNLRYVKYLSCKILPNKVRFRGSFGGTDTPMNELAEGLKKYDTKIPQWFYAWHGSYSNFFWQFKMFGGLWRFWIGWKIMPADVIVVSEYRRYGAGFAAQFKRIS